MEKLFRFMRICKRRACCDRELCHDEYISNDLVDSGLNCHVKNEIIYDYDSFIHWLNRYIYIYLFQKKKKRGIHYILYILVNESLYFADQLIPKS